MPTPLHVHLPTGVARRRCWSLSLWPCRPFAGALGPALGPDVCGSVPARLWLMAITSSPRPVPLSRVMHPRVNLWARHLLLSDPIAVCTCVETLFTPNSQGGPFLPWCCGCCHRRACHGCHGCHEPPREAPSPSFHNDLLSTS